MANRALSSSTIHAVDQASDEDVNPSEVISHEALNSLQTVTGIWSRGAEMTIFHLENRLKDLLDRAWRDVCPTLDVKDLWTLAQVSWDLDESFALRPNKLESRLANSNDPDVDPEGAKKLLPKLRTWDLATRWAVLRAVANSLNNAKELSTSRYAVPTATIEAEFRKVLAA